jgi:hypothetical protein
VVSTKMAVVSPKPSPRTNDAQSAFARLPIDMHASNLPNLRIK